ncbi:MAG: arginine--tRNA ligase [Alphaproteobacteria bacterium]|nr:arginine--tRNA ligase [Rickettsiales bacterium]
MSKTQNINNIIYLVKNLVEEATLFVAQDKKVELSSKEKSNIKLLKLDFIPHNLKLEEEIASNIAMVLVKSFKTDPKKIANQIGEHLVKSSYIDSFKVAGAGFLNIKLSKQCYVNGVQFLLKGGDEVLISQVGKGEKVNLEYVSANPTGPLHIGHVRGAVYGKSLATLLKKLGFNVTEEYYINDGGSQIDTLLKSALLRYKQAANNLSNADVKIPTSCYPGEYLIPVGKKIYQQYGKSLIALSEKEACEKIHSITLSAMLSLIKDSLKKLGVQHDIFVSEKEMVDNNYVHDAINILRDKDLCYRGKLDKPKGISADGWIPHEQELFKSSMFGDSSDRPISKSDGSFSYFAPDIGYHYYKYKRGFNKMILILGADHKGYSKRISAAVSAVSDNKATVEVKLCELVNFVEDGEKVKSSKRSGKFLTVEDVLKELDINVLRFIILSRKNDTTLDFDLKMAKLQSKENPVFYTQYAYSRCSSLLRGYKEMFKKPFSVSNIQQNNNWDIIDNKNVAHVILLCNMYPSIIMQVAKNYEINTVVAYVLNLATQFHSLWNGGDGLEVRFLNKDNKSLTDANMTIVVIVKDIIASCLNILGVKAPESM